MSRFYLTLLLLLLVSSVALTVLISSAGAMRGGTIDVPQILAAAAGFALFAVTVLLLTRILYVVFGRRREVKNGGSQ